MRQLNGYCHVFVGGYLSELGRPLGTYFRPMVQTLQATGLHATPEHILYLDSRLSVTDNAPLLREKLLAAHQRCGGDKPLLVFGHSMGGTTPTAMAIRYPQDVGEGGFISRIVPFQSPIRDMHTLDHRPTVRAADRALERGANFGILSGGTSLTGTQVNSALLDSFETLSEEEQRRVRGAVRFLATRSQPDQLPVALAGTLKKITRAGGEGDGLVATASMFDRESKFGYLLGVVPEGTPGMDHLSPVLPRFPLLSNHDPRTARALYLAYLQSIAADLRGDEERARRISEVAARGVRTPDREFLNRPTVVNALVEGYCALVFAFLPRRK